MADISDVLNQFVSTIQGILYPNGTGQPSITGIPAIIYAGWPTASQLDADLLKLSKNDSTGRMHVTVFPSKAERNTTRFMREWVQVTNPVITLFLTVNGNVVTVGGQVSVPQNVMLMVNGLPYVYGVKANDTLATVAAGLAALIPGASSSPGTPWTGDSGSIDADSSGFTADGAGVGSGGAIITLPTTANITAARVGGSGSSVLEIRRQERLFQITVWADTPAHRDVVAQAIDPVLANIEFLTFPDQSSGRLIYKSTWLDDMVSKAILYRRDLFYTVEYATTLTSLTQQIMTLGIHPSAGVPPAYQTLPTEYI